MDTFNKSTNNDTNFNSICLNQLEDKLRDKLGDTPDSIVSSVINKFLERAKIGKEKYGTNLDRTDLSLYDWIIHAQEEHMDAILYLEKIKKIIKN